MKCSEFIAFVARYVESELSPEEEAIFNAHIKVCTDCLAFLDSYCTTIRLESLVFSVPDDAPVPQEVPEELIQAVLAATTASK